MTDAVLVLIKPDGMYKAIAGEILAQFLASDLRLVGLKLVQVPKKLAEEHYRHIKGKPFFNDTVAYLMGRLHGGSPVVAMVFTGKDAVKKCRAIAGATNPEQADPKSVRGKFGRITAEGVFENLVHVSSDNKEAAREINLWFNSKELLRSNI
jgi:nucleoside-diphosphate kinase